MASEMLYPIMPVFLKSIGFSIVLIGILEGLAEAIAGLSKAWFGNLSDKMGSRLPFVQIGYFLSAISKPMMSLLIYPFWIFIARTTDRLGKGIRTGARDALLSDETTVATKASVFGFHRSMDTLGAVLGPAIALVWLYFNPGNYKQLFLLAFIPGCIAIFFTLIIKERKTKVDTVAKLKPTSFFVFFSFWKNSNPEYRRLVTGLLLFAMFNSSDVFLLLKAKEAGINDTYIISIYIFYNLIYAIAAFPVGIIADKIGMKKIQLIGFLLFAGVYTGFAFARVTWHFLLLFLFYGLYAAATEGISKAWISNIVNKNETATAIGTYTGFQSIMALIASSLAGTLWFCYGANFTFLITAGATFFVVVYIQRVCKD